MSSTCFMAAWLFVGAAGPAEGASEGAGVARATPSVDAAPAAVADDDGDDDDDGGALLETKPPAPPPADEHPDTVPEADKQLQFATHALDDEAGVYFKPGTGLVMQSKNKLFKLAPRLRVQFLDTVRVNTPVANPHSVDHSFQIRRARLQFGGHAFGQHNKYKLEIAMSPRDLGMTDGVVTKSPLLTWYVEFDYLRDLTLRVGQYKIPYSRQRVVSSGNLEFVDRTLANGEFNLDRDIGVDLRSNDLGGLGGRLRYYLGLYVGEGRDHYQTESLSDPDAQAGGLMYLARVELLPMGKFQDYSEVDFARGKMPRLSLGAAYAYLDEAKRVRGILGARPEDGGTTDYHNVTADFLFKWTGMTILQEFYWRRGSRNPGDAIVVDEDGVESPAPITAPRTGLGWSVQIGYLIPRTRLGVGVRYSQARAFGAETSLTDKDDVGGALSYYIAGHPLKLQLDYHHLRDDGFAGGFSDIIRVQLQFAY